MTMREVVHGGQRHFIKMKIDSRSNESWLVHFLLPRTDRANLWRGQTLQKVFASADSHQHLLHLTTKALPPIRILVDRLLHLLLLLLLLLLL
jgi:hypothetical protein